MSEFFFVLLFFLLEHSSNQWASNMLTKHLVFFVVHKQKCRKIWVKDQIKGKAKTSCCYWFFTKWTRIWHFTSDLSAMTYDWTEIKKERKQEKKNVRTIFDDMGFDAWWQATHTHLNMDDWNFLACKKTLRCDFSVQLFSITQFFLGPSIFLSIRSVRFTLHQMFPANFLD